MQGQPFPLANIFREKAEVCTHASARPGQTGVREKVQVHIEEHSRDEGQQRPAD
jgi:hypothetical protein